MIGNHWTLLASCTDKALGLVNNQRIRIEEQQAVALIDQGKARLAEKPVDPSTWLLRQLQEWMIPDALGPEISTPSQQNAIDETVFSGGLRRLFVDGADLNWHCGKIGLREMVGTRLSEANGAKMDLFMLFRLAALECTDRWVNDPIGLRIHVYGEEYSRERPYDPDDPDDDVIFYAGPFYSREWELFAGKALSRRHSRKPAPLALAYFF